MALEATAIKDIMVVDKYKELVLVGYLYPLYSLRYHIAFVVNHQVTILCGVAVIPPAVRDAVHELPFGRVGLLDTQPGHFHGAGQDEVQRIVCGGFVDCVLNVLDCSGAIFLTVVEE